MALAGRAWRGWFPVGGELTSGVPDHKEGLYLGRDLPADDPRVRAGRPLHGPNLWPAAPADLRPAVEAWMAAMAALAAARAAGAWPWAWASTGHWFAEDLTADPTILFRIFHYPPVPASAAGWGVAEHTDYGLLTLLAQDHHGGLEVRSPRGLDRAVAARPRGARAQRGRHARPHDRRPLPLDAPSGAAVPGGRRRRHRHLRCRSSTTRAGRPRSGPLPLADDDPRPDDAATRWDGTSLRTLEGTYGSYLTAKVAKVFPALADERPGG